METLLLYLPAIACLGMMAAIRIPMMRTMHKGHGGSEHPNADREIAELREEVARLKAQLTLDDARETADG